MIQRLKAIWRRILAWCFGTPPVQEPPPLPEGPRLDTQTRIQMSKVIGPDVFIENKSDTAVMLTGPVLRMVTVPAGGKIRIISPVLEQGIPFRNGIWMHGVIEVKEWDAFEVVDNMVKEHARGIAYDIMTPEELNYCTMPFPDRALGVVLDRVGLRVYRDEENEASGLKANS